MSSILPHFQKNLIEYFHHKQESSALHCLSVFQCYKPQQLHHVPFHQPTLLIVADGQKKAEIRGTKRTINKGELLIIPPDTTLWLGQYPDQHENRYLGLAFRFEQQALKHFRMLYGSSFDTWDISAQWQRKAPDSIITSLIQWLSWDKAYPIDSQLIQLKQVELLLLLAKEGLVGNILLGEHPSWKQRVSQLLFIDPSRPWQISEVCTRLAVSESSLRRRLQNEHCSFRELLEEARLATGLSMILETRQPIGKIAMSVGYLSQSRFGERFKKRFGMTPSELRSTLDA